MYRLVKLTVFASALALASLGASHFATAQTMRECIDCVKGGDGGGGPDVGNGQNQGHSGRRQKQFEQSDGQGGSDQGTSSRRKWKSQPDDQADFDDGGSDQGTQRKGRYRPKDQFQKGDDDGVVTDKRRVRQADRRWKFDSNRHERRRHKDKRFRFYFDGFWYPQAYWDLPYYDYDRVSCREGAEIVSERFSRVRIVDCGGRVYTYFGRRRGETFE
ncbi:MAG: hypothetical protein AB7S59_08595, partial [Parvibaculaceae bacterium]